MTNIKINKFYGTCGLIAQISDEFRDLFQSQLKERGQKQKDALIMAIRLWMSLPIETQAKLINQPTSENTLIETVEGVVNKKLEEFKRLYLDVNSILENVSEAEDQQKPQY